MTVMTTINERRDHMRVAYRIYQCKCVRVSGGWWTFEGELKIKCGFSGC